MTLHYFIFFSKRVIEIVCYFLHMLENNFFSFSWKTPIDDLYHFTRKKKLSNTFPNYKNIPHVWVHWMLHPWADEGVSQILLTLNQGIFCITNNRLSGTKFSVFRDILGVHQGTVTPYWVKSVVFSWTAKSFCIPYTVKTLCCKNLVVLRLL